jgi:hypothetical protein
MLEAIAVRWLRRETADLVAAVHTCGEYLPLLAWEPVLGHAADPARMAASVGGLGSRWGDPEDPVCPQTRAQKAAAERCLRVAGEPDPGWRTYLDRLHSLVAQALVMCAADCKTPCSVMTRHDAATRDRLAAATRVAAEFSGSAIVRLRHASPLGHGFGVPSPREVEAAWLHTRETIGGREPAVLIDDAYPLPGMPSLFAAVAGVPIRPSTMISDTMTALRHALF